MIDQLFFFCICCYFCISSFTEEDTTVNLTNDEQDCSSNLSIDNQNLVDVWDSQENQMQDIQDIQLQTTLNTIIGNKSSKKIYKAVAKEWGITCKMSEQCRCLDCQGNYFDCEFDEVNFPFNSTA